MIWRKSIVRPGYAGRRRSEVWTRRGGGRSALGSASRQRRTSWSQHPSQARRDPPRAGPPQTRGRSGSPASRSRPSSSACSTRGWSTTPASRSCSAWRSATAVSPSSSPGCGSSAPATPSARSRSRSFGAFWLSFWALVTFFAADIPAAHVGDAVGLYLIAWGIFTAYMFVASLRTTAAVALVFFLLAITFFLLGIGNSGGNEGVVEAGGWFGLATAVAAWYASFAGGDQLDLWTDGSAGASPGSLTRRIGMANSDGLSGLEQELERPARGRPLRAPGRVPRGGAVERPRRLRGGGSRPRGLVAAPGHRAARVGDRAGRVARRVRAALLQVVRRRPASTPPPTVSTATSRRDGASASPTTGAARRARSATSPTPSCSPTSSASPTRCATAGSSKGDVVGIYLPMIPEVVVAMLACARIGAPHNVVFGGFSAEAVRERMEFSQAKALVTVDGARRKGQTAPVKPAGRRGDRRGRLDRDDLRRPPHRGRVRDARRARRLVRRGAAPTPTPSARPSRWRPSTRSTSSTPRARRRSRRGSSTRPAAT